MYPSDSSYVRTEKPLIFDVDSTINQKRCNNDDNEPSADTAIMTPKFIQIKESSTPRVKWGIDQDTFGGNFSSLPLSEITGLKNNESSATISVFVGQIVSVDAATGVIISNPHGCPHAEIGRDKITDLGPDHVIAIFDSDEPQSDIYYNSAKQRSNLRKGGKHGCLASYSDDNTSSFSGYPPLLHSNSRSTQILPPPKRSRKLLRIESDVLDEDHDDENCLVDIISVRPVQTSNRGIISHRSSKHGRHSKPPQSAEHLIRVLSRGESSPRMRSSSTPKSSKSRSSASFSTTYMQSESYVDSARHSSIILPSMSSTSRRNPLQEIYVQSNERRPSKKPPVDTKAISTDMSIDDNSNKRYSTEQTETMAPYSLSQVNPGLKTNELQRTPLAVHDHLRPSYYCRPSSVPMIAHRNPVRQ